MIPVIFLFFFMPLVGQAGQRPRHQVCRVACYFMGFDRPGWAPCSVGERFLRNVILIRNSRATPGTGYRDQRAKDSSSRKQSLERLRFGQLSICTDAVLAQRFAFRVCAWPLSSPCYGAPALGEHLAAILYASLCHPSTWQPSWALPTGPCSHGTFGSLLC